MLPIRTILHPSDFSDSPCARVRAGLCSRGSRLRARLIILHVNQTTAIYARMASSPPRLLRRLRTPRQIGSVASG